MKLELTQGCVCDSFTADGKPLCDMTAEQLLAILSRTARTIAYNWRERDIEDWRKSQIIQILAYMMEDFPDTEDHSSQPCECCGDLIDHYTLNI